MKTFSFKMNQKKLVALLSLFLFIGFTAIRPEFLSPVSIDNIVRNVSLYGIASLGMTLVILTGGTDLSAGSVMAFSGIVGAGLLGNAIGAANPIRLPFVFTMMIALALCAAIGTCNGLLVTRLHIAPFAATLAMMLIVRGLVYVAADFVVQGVSGSPVTFMNEGYNALGLGSYGRLPIQTILYGVCFLVLCVFLRYTMTGRNIYAVGGNAEIAKLSGIKINKTRILCYTISSLLAGISGLVLVGKLSSASTVAAKGYELDFITATALGGTSMAGGRGGVTGTLIGSVFLGVLNNGLDMINIPSFYQYLIKGMILVLAVYADNLLRFFEKHTPGFSESKFQ